MFACSGLDRKMEEGFLYDLCVIHWKKQLMFPGHNRVKPGLFLAPCGLGGLHIVESVTSIDCWPPSVSHLKKEKNTLNNTAVYSICSKSGKKKRKAPRCLIGWRVEGKSVWLALSNRRGLKLLVCNYYKAYVSRYPPISRLDGGAEGCAARRAVCALGQAWRDPGNRNILLLSQCHDADTPARSPRQAGLPPLPIISILCSSAQDGGAGSGKGRNSEYVGAGAGFKNVLALHFRA